MAGQRIYLARDRVVLRRKHQRVRQIVQEGALAGVRSSGECEAVQEMLKRRGVAADADVEIYAYPDGSECAVATGGRGIRPGDVGNRAWVLRQQERDRAGLHAPHQSCTHGRLPSTLDDPEVS